MKRAGHHDVLDVLPGVDAGADSGVGLDAGTDLDAGTEPEAGADAQVEPPTPVVLLAPVVPPPAAPIATPLDESSPPEPTASEVMSLPEECLLAPVEPELVEESLDILGDSAEQDYTPVMGQGWDWTGNEDEELVWPYPAREVWPAMVELPLAAEEFELLAIAGPSRDDFYVVGRRQELPLVLHWTGAGFVDESDAVVGALPSATLVNSVSVPARDQVFVTTPEGLLRSDGSSNWRTVEVPDALLPLGGVWVDPSGFGTLAGGTVATTQDGGQSFELETRQLGFVAPGLAYSRSFVRVAGRGTETAVVGRYGHLITRGEDGWTASTLLASDVAFGAGAQFMTTRNSSPGLFFREEPNAWQIQPLSMTDSIDRVHASPGGDVFAGGNINAVLHRFEDGTVELLPSEVSDLTDFHGDASFLYALAPSSLWFYDLGDVRTSGAARAQVVDDSVLAFAPTPATVWGQRAASNFEALECVDGALDVGAPAYSGELAAGPPRARYGSCYGAERQFSETAFSFTAPIEGTYRIVLTELDVDPDAGSALNLALRNGCEGWLIWGGGFVGNVPAVDIGLSKGQVLLIEIWAGRELEAPVSYELSIY